MAAAFESLLEHQSLRGAMAFSAAGDRLADGRRSASRRPGRSRS